MTTIHPPVPSTDTDDMEISPVQPTIEQSHPLSQCSSQSCDMLPSANPKRHTGPTKPLKWYHFSYPSSFLDLFADWKARRQEKKTAAFAKGHFKAFDQSPDSQTPDEKSSAPQTPERQSSVAFAPLPTRENGYDTPPLAGREKLKPLDMAVITPRAINKSPETLVNTISLSPLEQQMASETKSFAALGSVSRTSHMSTGELVAPISTHGPKMPEVPKMQAKTIYVPCAALGSVSKTSPMSTGVPRAPILTLRRTYGPKIFEVPKVQSKTIYGALGSVSETPRVQVEVRKASTSTDGPKIPEVPKMQLIRKTPCDCENCKQMSAIFASRCRRDLEEFFLLLGRD
ncbi:hypothetical protein LTR56_022155 [Elasticomyces elasticus]|nr:hypothetical protein LTR56_022155 [Elasticomyces elasticus]KAK3628612.1 hypothetical protein LTR22_022297 [Elasticomyces elasticus]KAK4913403.1 hypothetical protein LTR49_018291 [Elasticomyces elasticus]KAK5754609.1 hypothetical protein LTS12_015333 [Elasticomyces elasticus]